MSLMQELMMKGVNNRKHVKT